MCVNREYAVRVFGNGLAEKLTRRMADIRAAETPIELLVGNPHPVAAPASGLFSVDLDSTIKLVFSANHANPPMLGEGKVDWAKVSRIKITHIGDGYGI